MGIPRFQKDLNKHDNAQGYIRKDSFVGDNHYDAVFIDANQLLHQAISANDDQTFKTYRKQLLKVIRLFPKSVDTVYVAFDGVAPFAKRNTQRETRFETTRKMVHGVFRDVIVRGKVVRVCRWIAEMYKDKVLSTKMTEEVDEEEDFPKVSGKHEKEENEEEIKEEQKQIPLKKRKVMSKEKGEMEEEEDDEDDESDESNDEIDENDEEKEDSIEDELQIEEEEITQSIEEEQQIAEPTKERHVPRFLRELLSNPNVYISGGSLKRTRRLHQNVILKSQKTIELSPSTDLMHKLYEFTVLIFAKACKCKKVVISPSTVEGEGETKIMKYFRNHCVKKNGKYLIISSDSDMILSALILLHEFKSMNIDIKIHTMQEKNVVFCNVLYKSIYHIPTFVISILLKSGCDYFSRAKNSKAQSLTHNIFYKKSNAFEIEEKEDGKIILTINQSSLDMLFNYRIKRDANGGTDLQKNSVNAKQKENVEKFLKQVIAVYYQFGGKITIMKTFDFKMKPLKKGELFSYLNNFTDDQIIIETSRKEIEEQFKITPLESLYSLISCHNGHALPSPEHAKVFKHNEFLTKLFDHSNLTGGTELFKSEKTYIELRKAFQEIGIEENHNLKSKELKETEVTYKCLINFF
ncbi:hypothetical protein ABK040_001947 [Willaertia magna]